MIVQVIGAFIAVITFAIILSIPRKFLFTAGSISALSWFVYLVCWNAKLSVAMSTLAATLVIALVSHILARLLKAPVTIFLIPGILPLVPGINTYRIGFYLIQDDGAKASYYFNLTLQVAGMIAIGIFIMDTIFRIMNTLLLNHSRKKMVKEEIGTMESMGEIGTMGAIESMGAIGTRVEHGDVQRGETMKKEFGDGHQDSFK